MRMWLRRILPLRCPSTLCPFSRAILNRPPFSASSVRPSTTNASSWDFVKVDILFLGDRPPYGVLAVSARSGPVDRAGSPGATVRGDRLAHAMELSERERAIIDFERSAWQLDGPKEAAIRAELGLSPTRYY